MSTTDPTGRRRVAGPARRDDEAGFAMIIAVAITGIGMMLMMMMLTTGVHLQTATQRSKHWNLALQVAEAGVERAVSHLVEDESYTGTGPDGEDVAGGVFVTTVTTPEPGWRVVTSTGWVPSPTAPAAVNRRLQVTYGPSASFEFALFSYTTLDLKNTGIVRGDLFGNESVSMLNAMTVEGSVVSATGSVYLNNGVEVRRTSATDSGSVYSGGIDPIGLWGIKIENNAVIEHNATAEVEACDQTRVAGQQAYNIVNRGDIQGVATAGGYVTGGADGGTLQYACNLRHARAELPEFHYDPALYEDVTEWSSVETFNDDPGRDLIGVHRVTPTLAEQLAGSDVIDFTGKNIAGDFTLITTGRFYYGNSTSGTAFYDGPLDANVTIIVLNDSESEVAPAIQIENQLELPNPGPAVLFYAPGLIDVKNGAEGDGAVYAGKLKLKNNVDFTYDPRVERVLGFGPSRFERVSYVELKPERRNAGN